MACQSEEECRRCIILGGCGGGSGLAIKAAIGEGLTPGSALAGMLREEGAERDLEAACSRVLVRLGLPIRPGG